MASQEWRVHPRGHRAGPGFDLRLAAGEYSALQQAVAQNKTNEIDVRTDSLMKDYSDTAWAVFAAGERAQRNLVAGQLDKVGGDLDWAKAHAKDETLQSLVELRIAQLKFAQGKAEDAIATLDAMKGKSFAAIAQELRGDALVKLG